jgi:hypothetical protein
MKQKFITVVMVVAVMAIAFLNVNIIATKGHSTFNLNSIFKTNIANAELPGGDDDCEHMGEMLESEYGGCKFIDYYEWCEGTAGSCITNAFQLRNCTGDDDDWEEICSEDGVEKNC